MWCVCPEADSTAPTSWLRGVVVASLVPDAAEVGGAEVEVEVEVEIEVETGGASGEVSAEKGGWVSVKLQRT